MLIFAQEIRWDGFLSRWVGDKCTRTIIYVSDIHCTNTELVFATVSGIQPLKM